MANRFMTAEAFYLFELLTLVSGAFLVTDMILLSLIGFLVIVEALNEMEEWL